MIEEISVRCIWFIIIINTNCTLGRVEMRSRGACASDRPAAHFHLFFDLKVLIVEHIRAVQVVPLRRIVSKFSDSSLILSLQSLPSGSSGGTEALWSFDDADTVLAGSAWLDHLTLRQIVVCLKLAVTPLQKAFAILAFLLASSKMLKNLLLL